MTTPIGTHWDDCWRHHPACAVAKLERLERALRRPPETQSGPVLVDQPQVVGHIPTWAGPSDEPPEAA